MALLLNYPFNGTIDNSVIGINSNDFTIVSSNIQNNFQSSVAQGKYLVSNQIKLVFGIPEVHNYTSIYNTSPWQIDFEMCSLADVPVNNTGIFALQNNSIAYAIYFEGKAPKTLSENSINTLADTGVIYETDQTYTVAASSYKPPGISGIYNKLYRRAVELSFDKDTSTYSILVGIQKGEGASSSTGTSYPDNPYFHISLLGSSSSNPDYFTKANIYIEYNGHKMIDSMFTFVSGQGYLWDEKYYYTPNATESALNAKPHIKIVITDPSAVVDPDQVSTKKNVEITRQSTRTWLRYSIVNTNNTIYTYIDGQLVDKYSRAFNLDSTNVTLTVGSLDNNVLCGIKNIKVYYGETQPPSRGTYNHETTASIVVRKAVSNVPLEVEIPFPYKQFTEMEFILSDKYRNFISDKYYQRTDDTHIYFPLSSVNTLNLNDEDELRFTFCHNKGFYSINKIEYHAVTKSTQREYKFNTPFGEIMDLDTRFKVFYDRKLLYPDSDIHYKFNLYEGIFIFDEDFEIEDNKDLDIVVFYTGNKFNRAVTTLPMSGYITLKKHEIDRNYNKNLMGIFVNGKLVNRNDIIDMSNNIHKISRDIESRYNVEVKSFSPKISSLIPFYKKRSHMLDIPKQYCYHEFPCMFTIPYPNDPYNRQKLENTGLNPILLDDINPDHYISLIHHGYQDTKDIDTVVRYDLYFYRDDYIKNPEDVSVLAQIRTSGNEGQFKWIPDSDTVVLVGKIPAHMTSTLVDYSLMSIKIKTIITQDSSQNNNTIDGIVCRFGILKNTKDKYYPVYYELDTNVYEHGDTVGIFEWIISTEPEGKGEVIYRRTVFLHPDNDPYDREVNE